MQSIKNRGFTLIEVLLALAVAGVAAVTAFQHLADNIKRERTELAAQRYSNVANAIIRYQSDTGDSTATPPIEPPLNQHDIVGQPFYNGAVHIGTAWLKGVACGGVNPAPSSYLQCSFEDKPIIGDDSVYRATINNDGITISVSLSITDSSSAATGFKLNGVIDAGEANNLATATERLLRAGFSSSNNVVKADHNGIVTATLSNTIGQSPYMRRDGLVEGTGDQRFGDKNLSNINELSATSITTKRLESSISNSYYIEPHLKSVLNELDVTELLSDEIETDNLKVTGRLNANEISTEAFEQTNPSYLTSIAGDLSIGEGSVRIGSGDVELNGVVKSSVDPSYFVDPKGISRIEDLVLGSRGNVKLSNLLPNYVKKGTLLVANNQTIPMPLCTNGEPRLELKPMRWTTVFLKNGSIVTNENLNSFTASKSSTNWITILTYLDLTTFKPVGDPNALALAEVYCFYPT